MSSDDRANRVARNEAAFREINATLEEGFSGIRFEQGEPAGFVCECGHADCRALVHIPMHRYEWARSDRDRFVIMAGHEIPDVERVVDQGERWAIVEKLDRGDALDIVRNA